MPQTKFEKEYPAIFFIVLDFIVGETMKIDWIHCVYVNCGSPRSV
jgi:hypothetical protein